MNCANHPTVPASAYCRTCGKAVCENCKRDVKGVIYCQDCLAARLEGTVPPGTQLPAGTAAPPPAFGEGVPNPAIATILGFIPGVGAFYNGQFAKGFIHVVVFALLIKLADSIDVFGIFVAFWFFYMVVDAYKTAKARQLGLPLPDPLGLNNLFGTPEPAVRPVAPPPAPAAAATPAQPFVPGAYPQRDEQYVAPAYTYRRGPTGAVILIALGVLFLLDNLGIFRWSWTGRYWPVILIVVGIYLAARRMAEARGQQEQSNG